MTPTVTNITAAYFKERRTTKEPSKDALTLALLNDEATLREAIALRAAFNRAHKKVVHE